MRILFGDFLTRRGIQIRVGVNTKPYHWMTFLAKALFGYAFFGLSGQIESGMFALGIQRHGTYWELHIFWTKLLEKRKAKREESKG